MDRCSDADVAAVIEHVADRFALHAADLTGKSRAKEVVRARQLAMWCCRRLQPQPPLPAIGRAFNRDHTSVLEALRVADGLLLRYPVLADAVSAWRPRRLPAKNGGTLGESPL